MIARLRALVARLTARPTRPAWTDPQWRDPLDR